MIRYDLDTDVFHKNEHENIVILQQVNCYGNANTGLPARISKRYSKWYDDYSEYCKWFSPENPWNSKDFTDDIRGTFHRFLPDDSTIICSAFTINGGKKERGTVDNDLWMKVIRKVFNLTVYANKRNPDKKWTIHIQADIGKMKKDDDNTELMSMFEQFFSNSSDADIVVHG